MTNPLDENVRKRMEELTLGKNKPAYTIKADDFKKSAQDATKTIGSYIGEFVWLLGQSPAHKRLSISDLEWLLYPPIILDQYKIYRDDNKKPVAFALWGYLSQDAEKRLIEDGKLEPQDWGNDAVLDQVKGLIRNEGGQMWLVDILAPFHTAENQHRDQVVLD